MHFLYKTHGCKQLRSLTHTDTHSEIVGLFYKQKLSLRDEVTC